MPLSLDHVVIFITDLDRAMADYRALGFTVLVGGDHPDGVTHNALVVFQDGAYLELISYRKAAPDRRWWQVGSRDGEGFVDFALLPRNIAADLAEMQARGLTYAGPFDGGRTRPDGEILVWKTARAQTADLPFFCGDVTPRRLRVEEGACRNHSNGVQGVARIDIAVNDADQSRSRYEALLGADAFRGEAVSDGLRELTFALGTTDIVLISPTSGDRSQNAARLADRLDRRGEGPCKLWFLGGAAFKPSLTHGAAFEAVE